MVNIIDVMEKTSTNILDAKKRAFEKGDEAVLHQVAEGKDIMSVLCEFLVLLYLWTFGVALSSIFSASQYVCFRRYEAS